LVGDNYLKNEIYDQASTEMKTIVKENTIDPGEVIGDGVTSAMNVLDIINPCTPEVFNVNNKVIVELDWTLRAVPAFDINGAYRIQLPVIIMAISSLTLFAAY
jgi:hypothetical protein